MLRKAFGACLNNSRIITITIIITTTSCKFRIQSCYVEKTFSCSQSKDNSMGDFLVDGKITIIVNSNPFCYRDKSIGLAVYLPVGLMYCQLK